MATISVTIDGKTYRMACDAGQEEHLSGLAEKLDHYISHLKESFGEIGDHRLSVMAGIMVMDELSENQRELEKIKQENEKLRKENDKYLKLHEHADTQVSDAINKAAEHIETLTARLSANL